MSLILYILTGILIVLYLIKTLFNWTKKDYKFRFKEVLDNKNWKYKKIIFSENNKLVKAIKIFLEENIPRNTKYIAVSLSGGVDSMVLSYILNELKNINGYNYKVVCVLLNWNNRKDSIIEQSFLEKWCSVNNMILEIHSEQKWKRGVHNRQQYEEETKKIRYRMYRDIIKQYKCDGMYLAHHKDDIIENITSNIFQGRSIMDLSVIKAIKEIDGVRLLKPLVDFPKEDIYEYARINNLPWFYDSTPKWSVRWRVRFKLFPLLKNIYGNIEEALFKAGKQSDELNDIFNREIIQPYLRDMIEYEDTRIIFKLSDIIQQRGLIFWKTVIHHAFRKQEIPSPRNKVFKNFMQYLKKGNYITYLNGIRGRREGDEYIIYLHEYNKENKEKKELKI